MALFGFLQEPLHLSLPKYRSRQQMPVKLRRNNARRRARFVPLLIRFCSPATSTSSFKRHETSATTS